MLAALGFIGAGGLLWWFLLRGPSDPEWKLFKHRFITGDGRVVDTGNGGITHSEGQGYGMILAVHYGDRAVFDRLWRWTKENLQTRPDDRLLSWLWRPSPDGGGAVADPNNASDGELLVSWALVRAAKRWGVFAYEQSAAEMLIDLRRICVVDTPEGAALLPGAMGFSQDGERVLNGSYYVFPALRELATAFPGAGWDILAASGQRFLAATKFGEWELNPDWVAQTKAGYSLQTKFPPDFGYNAVRVPLQIAWDNPRSPLLKSYANFWNRWGDLSKMPATVNLVTNAFGSDPSLPGMQAIAFYTVACAKGAALSATDIPPLTGDEPYYSASLKLLTRMAVRESSGGSK